MTPDELAALDGAYAEMRGLALEGIDILRRGLQQGIPPGSLMGHVAKRITVLDRPALSLMVATLLIEVARCDCKDDR